MCKFTKFSGTQNDLSHFFQKFSQHVIGGIEQCFTDHRVGPSGIRITPPLQRTGVEKGAAIIDDPQFIIQNS